MTIYEYYLIVGGLIFVANIVLFFANRRLNNKTKALLEEIRVLNEGISSNWATFNPKLEDSLMSERTVH